MSNVIIYRRHQPPCTQSNREHTGCKCPVHLDWRVGSQRIRKSLKTKNWQKAIKIARRIEMEGFKEQSVSPLIPDAAKQFLADAETRGLKQPTLYKFKLLFRQMETFAQNKGHVFISDLTVESLREFRQSWANTNFSAQKKLENLRAFFRFCNDSGWIQTNPARLLKSGKTHPLSIVPFTPEEITKILKACAAHPHILNRKRLRALVLLMNYSGLRIGDAIMLERSAIQNGNLRLRTAKSGTDVSCPLPPICISALAAIPKDSGERYFWTGIGTVNSVSGDYHRALRTIFKKAGVAGKPHNFRHTFATRLLSKGVPIEDVAEILGHSSSRITSKYYKHWVSARQELLAANIRKTWTQSDTKS